MFGLQVIAVAPCSPARPRRRRGRRRTVAFAKARFAADLSGAERAGGWSRKLELSRHTDVQAPRY